MKQWTAVLAALGLLLTPAFAEEREEVFQPGDHCIAYRVVKDMLFAKDVIVTAPGCKVTARLVSSDDEAGPRVIVEAPIKSLKSGNIMRDYSVADILEAGDQPNLRFTSEPLGAETFQQYAASRGFVLSGQLSIAGVDHAVSFPLEVVEFEGRQYVTGRLSTSFADFGMKPPTAAVGLIARVHEELELLVHLDLSQVEGLEDAVRQ
jgi:polyisoprenoid-binding protein YceI